MVAIIRKTRIRLVGAGVMILLALTISCVTQLGEPEPTLLPSVPAPALLLDERPFPKGWAVDPCGPNLSRCFRETYATQGLGRIGIAGNALQHVFRFENIAAAKAKFQRVREVDFARGRNEPSTEFLPPTEIRYRSPIADEYYLGCGVDIVPACRVIFRYGNYFIDFYLDLDSYLGYGLDHEGDGLRIEEVEPILRAMDERAASVLGIPLPTKTP